MHAESRNPPRARAARRLERCHERLALAARASRSGNRRERPRRIPESPPASRREGSSASGRRLGPSIPPRRLCPCGSTANPEDRIRALLLPMRQSVSLITLGVADYQRAKSFYEALGWSVTLDIEETAFFQANGVVLVLWGREKLAADMGISDDDGARWGGVALAHNVGSDEEVDRVIEDARAAGADVVREPSPTFYGGYPG